MNQLIILKTAATLMSTSTTSIKRQIKNGTMTPPITIGSRNLLVESEVSAIINARIKGFTDEQIKQLVIELIEKRGEL
ncbi:hypothetical protein GLP37_21550 [Photobacterium phosphoreum]|uniref:helix-turn-helix transcriptional regulator n=1 Tax=Photobacterium phosphoreum TaxID=659 RepID=UPI001E6528AC|nr:hypothetical protein [Photobacterium phosphoreum]MCD9504751.1 hypothetical protein [Photobacterium phosphoreum]